MDKDELIKRLMDTFLDELDEHVRALNRDLLALEKGPAPQAREELLGTIFRTAHSLKGAARSVSVDSIENVCHRLEEIFAAVRAGERPLSQELFHLLFSAADALAEAGGRLRAKDDLSQARLDDMLALLDSAPGKSAPLPPKPVPPPAPAGAGAAPQDAVVRISAEKLDALLARSGELLVARRRHDLRRKELETLQEFVEGWRSEWGAVRKAFKEAAPRQTGRGDAAPAALPRRARLVLDQAKDNLRKLTKDLDRLAIGLAGDARALEQAAAPLDEEIRRVRMLPFAQACEGLERAARDLAQAANKEVELSIEGGEVELDRSILAELKDPLLHLVRNAVDHGIEAPQTRREAGKPSRGRIVVSAALRGSRVQVSVEDDGRGLDLAVVREAAGRQKVAAPADEQELARLVFLPGFSTAPIITKVSGRGVGLDVVKSRVESLHGSVGFSFQAGRGARFALSLPLTLTTIRALLVSAGGQTFVLAGTNVRRLLRVGAGDLRRVQGREAVLLGERPVPIVSLAELLGLQEREPERPEAKRPAVLLVSGDRQAAVTVDALLSEQEVVVKSLGRRLHRLANAAGATILPSGRIALILNAGQLIEKVLGQSPGRALAAAAPPLSAARKRLIVVDDSLTTRTLEKSILEAAGYETVAAADGAEAWRLLQESGADLVVSDVEMPRMDGLALTESIRASKRFRELPVVLVTAHETERDKARGIEAGADAYLLKSAFDQKNLLETIAQLL